MPLQRWQHHVDLGLWSGARWQQQRIKCVSYRHKQTEIEECSVRSSVSLTRLAQRQLHVKGGGATLFGVLPRFVNLTNLDLDLGLFLLKEATSSVVSTMRNALTLIHFLLSVSDPPKNISDLFDVVEAVRESSLQSFAYYERDIDRNEL